MRSKRCGVALIWSDIFLAGAPGRSAISSLSPKTDWCCAPGRTEVSSNSPRADWCSEITSLTLFACVGGPDETTAWILVMSSIHERVE
eukprot:4367077-Pyramimonas_sp.AAC.1